MGIIKSKFKKMEEFDCSVDDLKLDEKPEIFDPRSPSPTITRTPLAELRAKGFQMARATNLKDVSSTTKDDLLIIQGKRFKHLAHSFIDPRSPSEGIVRTPIVLKSTDVSSIVNTPRILEEELRMSDEDDELQQTFEEALSKMSFDDFLENEIKQPQPMETHFDCLVDTDPNPLITVQPLQPETLVTKLSAKLYDPRSPSMGIDRTPLVLGPSQGEAPKSPSSFELFVRGEEGEAMRPEIVLDSAKDEEQRDETESSAEVFIDVGHVIYGTPVKMSASTPIQVTRTPLSCLGNHKRIDLNGQATTKSPVVGQQPRQKSRTVATETINGNELKVKRSATGLASKALESPATRKLIR